MNQTDNRRAHPRYTINVSAELLLGEDRIPCHTRNLSGGGVGVVLSLGLAEKQPLIVNLFLVEDGIEDATTPSLNIQATVVWSAEVDGGRWEAGLRFTEVHPQQTKLLQHFLGRLTG